jgi:uncharacterized phage protein (TIGR01671 family)
MKNPKFRVWNNKSKTWKGAGYNANGEDRCGHLCCKLKNGIFTLDSTENLIYQLSTGLLDKDNKEIYDGDIVKVIMFEDWNDDTGHNVIYMVKWCSKHIGFRGFNKKMIDSGYSGVGLPKPIEIIGNIFENPELLK